MDKEKLKQEALKWRKWFHKGQRNWSAMHHFTIFGSIFCSVGAGALLQFRKPEFEGWPAILTSVAAALTSLAAAGGFERKWKSNRLSRSHIDCLLIDLESPTTNALELAAQLKDIIARHDEEIVKSDVAKPKEAAKEQKDGKNP